MTERRRLLIVTRNLPPLTGGMERLLHRAVLELAQEFDLCVIGPSGARSHLPDSVLVRTTPGVGLLGFLPCAVPLALWSAWRFRPDGILAGSGVTAPVAWLVSRLWGIRYAVLAHGLDVIARNPVYQSVFVPCMRRADLVIANSGNTRTLCANAGLPAARTVVLPPGVQFPPKFSDAGFRERYGVGNRPMLLSVGRIVPRKGLVDFVAQCMPAIVAAYPDACLAIVGEEPAQALKGTGSETAAIHEAVRAAGLASAVIMCGRLPEALLDAAYREADLFVFPVLDLPGDVEGFGMVAVEAAASGLSTIGFRAGGLEDAVIDGTTGRLAEPGRYDTLTALILEALGQGRGRYHETCLQHAEKHSWKHYGEALFGHLRRLFVAHPPTERSGK